MIPPDDYIRQAADLVRDARCVTALVGAGLSAGSGVPTYRGAGGLWMGEGMPPLLSYQEFARDPVGWWRARLAAEVDPAHPVYRMKRAVDRAVPNAGHLALAELERRGILRCVITQNVDGLHAAAGSCAVLEIHGNRNRLRCIVCGWRFPRYDDSGIDCVGLPSGGGPPLCGQCGGIVKLDTVMFGEPIPPDTLRACREAAERCDCMLLVGTSGTVSPAARLPLLAQERGAALIEINPETTSLTPHCSLVFHGAAGVVLSQLLRWL